ncbi:MAG: AraC family transcriptional regulator [Rhodocyclaceae bacterium]
MNDLSNPLLAAAQRELLELMASLTVGVEGSIATPLDGLHLHRIQHPTGPHHAMQAASFCLIAQGAKRVLVGDQAYEYDPFNYFVSSVDLPVAGRVAVADDGAPYLGLRLDIDVDEIAALIRHDGLPPVIRTEDPRGVYISRLDLPMLDAVLRMLRLLLTPEDAPVLAPLIRREILYRLLINEQGARLRQMVVQDSHTHRIAKVIRLLRDNYAQPLRVESLARDVHMSVSSLHHHFKAVTAMSPLQYQKQLRLQEARRLMLLGEADVSMAAHRVGYESPSQFSREYSRLFGASPINDKRRWLAVASA